MKPQLHKYIILTLLLMLSFGVFGRIINRVNNATCLVYYANSFPPSDYKLDWISGKYPLGFGEITIYGDSYVPGDPLITCKNGTSETVSTKIFPIELLVSAFVSFLVFGAIVVRERKWKSRKP